MSWFMFFRHLSSNSISRRPSSYGRYTLSLSLLLSPSVYRNLSSIECKHFWWNLVFHSLKLVGCLLSLLFHSKSKICSISDYNLSTKTKKSWLFVKIFFLLTLKRQVGMNQQEIVNPISNVYIRWKVKGSQNRKIELIARMSVHWPHPELCWAN